MAIDDEERHRMNVLLEDIRANQQAMFEGMTAMESRLTREFRAEIARIHVRLEAVESAVKQNSADVREMRQDIRALQEDTRQLQEETRQLREELRRLRHDFNSREELERIASLEERVTALERSSKVG